ncbi:hypothetical protein [Psychrosphaera algicola]|uniref:PilZ domain-containing protein n=1 Tax=Psychrosphaera algicola TaxID=3023714 RepID=A0ABT5FD15_9GAMM|nr:hypothetical protein [Psychrosphaera sp. G1-22]MDC2889422.1 hypothetical protein [Psychrosphaera sp. G1-22]
MAILKGINHIGEPCARVLDFRIYFYEMCKSFECNGIRHFLDPESIDVFNALLDKTEGRYTLGVYEELSNYAKRRYARLPESEKETGPAIDTKLIQLNRRKIKSIRECGIKHDVSEDDIDINALVDSIEQRVLEQHYLNNNKSVFYTLDNGLNNFKPLSVFLSDSNYTFWESLQIDQHSCVVSALVLKPEFQAVLSQSQNITKFYLIKKLLVNDQTDFVAVDFTKLSLVLAEHPELQDALTSEEVRLIKIDIMSTHIRSNIEAPSVLNSQNNIRLQSINKPPSRDVTTLLSSSDKLLSVSDVSDMLWNLNLLKPYAKQDNSESLPVSLLQYVIRPRMATQKISVAVNNNNDCRMEDRFHCNTTCIVIHRKTKKSFVGKTLNFSTKGLAVKFDESLDFNANDEVLVTLPSVSRRMNRTVKNQTYSVIEGDGTLLRLKVEGVAKEHQGRQLLSDFLQRYCGQLKASGKTEDILGLTQALRSVVSANHESMPFTYVMDKRTSFIEHLGVGNISISNLEKKIIFMICSDLHQVRCLLNM